MPRTMVWPVVFAATLSIAAGAACGRNGDKLPMVGGYRVGQVRSDLPSTVPCARRLADTIPTGLGPEALSELDSVSIFQAMLSALARRLLSIERLGQWSGPLNEYLVCWPDSQTTLHFGRDTLFRVEQARALLGTDVMQAWRAVADSLTELLGSRVPDSVRSRIFGEDAPYSLHSVTAFWALSDAPRAFAGASVFAEPDLSDSARLYVEVVRCMSDVEWSRCQ